MPRPRVANEKRQPIPPLNLEEMKFWLRIMEEHAQFIKAGLPCDSVALIGEADDFQQEFAALLAQAERVQNQQQFGELVGNTQAVVDDLFRYIRRLLHLVLTCQLLGNNFALFLDHLSRETEYFMILLATMGSGQTLYQAAGAREAAFWLRLMADHSAFISHRLDPSERSLQETADDFTGEFDELYLQGRDFVSMLRGETDEVPSFRRFLQDVRVSTIRLRDFKRAAETLIAECRLIGIIPALMADHVRREADHFLLVLAILEKSAFAPFTKVGELEYVDLEEHAQIPSPSQESFAAAVGDDLVSANKPGHYGDEDDEDGDEEEEPDDRVPVQPEPPELPLPPKAPEPPGPKPPKYKWSGKWPRPLGARE